MKKTILSTAVLLGCLFSIACEAAIAVRGASTAYYQSATVFTAGGAVAVVGSGSAVAAASGNVTPPLPAGIAAGDRLLCLVESHDNVTPTFPTGWTRLYRNSNKTTVLERSTAWYKVAVAGEVNPTVTHMAGGSIIAQCSAFRNATSAAPTAAGLTGTGANIKTGTLTTTLANELLLMAAHLNQGATTTSGWSMSTPGGLTWTQQFASTTTLGTGTPTPGSSIGLFTATKAAAGAQTAVTATIAGTVNATSINYGTFIDLKPGLGVNKPAGTVSGDLMVLSIAARSSTATITPPTGWTLLLSTTESTATTSKLSTYYRIAGASEPSSYTWSSGTTESVASMVSFSGVDTTIPFDGVTPLATANTLATTTQTAPSITPATANDWLVTVHELTSTPCSAGFTNGWTPPTGMTEQTDVCSRTSSSASGMGMEVNTLALTTAGTPTGTKIATAAANAARGISQSLVLRPLVVAVLDHIEIDYPTPPFSTCASTPVTVYACANTACSSYYTLGVSTVTLSPGGNVVSIPSGSGSASGTVFQSAGSTATLNAVASSPIAANTATCKDISTGVFNCSVSLAAGSLSVSLPGFVSGNTATGTVSGCTAQLPAGANTINFYTAYQNPASGTKSANINATPIATSSPGTGISLTFNGASPTSSASFSLSYPDVGQMSLTAVKGSSTGQVSFIAVPHHFTLTSITCGNGTTYTGCIVTSPYANPAAANASGAAFMKAGNPFSISVTAYNSAGAITPNFGRETAAESVSLTPVANMQDLLGAVAGNLTGSFGAFSNGVASGNAFSYDEAGIMTLTTSLHDPDAKGYLSIGNTALNPAGAASANIGRFIPDHFIVTTDPSSPIVTRSDLPPQMVTTVSAPAAVGDTVIGVADTTGFYKNSKARITGAGPDLGAGGTAFTANVTAVDPTGLTLTLDTAIITALAGDGSENVISEWGSYMGERMDAQFTLKAVELGETLTNNYQGAYARFNPAATGNPLGLGAMDDATTRTYNLPLDTSLTATGVFASGSATIIAPFAVTRGAAVAPYNSVKIGIAPKDADNIIMGGADLYDLGVAGTTPDHTSIMDPLVQNVTAVRYGRTRITNAYGSELLPLSLPVVVEYWNGSTYVTNTDDSISLVTAALGNYLLNLNSGETALNQPVIANGIGQAGLSAPGAGNNGSVDVTVTSTGYLPGSTARGTFGVYGGNSNFTYRGRHGR